MKNAKEGFFYKKLFHLLDSNHKKELVFLAILLIIGIFFEMLGLGILLPAITVLLDSDIGTTYPQLKPFLNYFGNPNQESLIFWGLASVVFVYFIKGIFLTYISFKQTKFAMTLTADLSSKLFLGYLKMPFSFHIKKNSSELLKNIQTEVGAFSNATKEFISLIVELSMVIGVFTTLIYVEPLGTLVILLFLLISVGFFDLITRKKLKTFGVRRINHSKFINKHLLQGLAGVKEVILEGKEEFFSRVYNHHNYSIARLHTFVGTLRLIPRLYLEFLAVVGLSAVILTMLYQNVDLNEMIPKIGIFVAAAFRMLPSFNRILSAIQQISFIGPLMDLLYDEFALINKNSNRIHNFSKNKLDFNSSIKLSKINFKYENNTISSLEDVSIEINKGEFIGIIGESGSGKTTILDLFLGLLNYDEGKFLVDGKILEKKSIRNWQNKIGYVPQTIYLIDDSLKANIAFGVPTKEIDDDIINKVIDEVQLRKLVSELSEGIDTFVGERGIRLSGGERQRIGIARALYNDPEILVLDEATSALDNSTEKKFMDSINKIKNKKTILIVAHRLSTVLGCDRLYELKQGKIISTGTPAELL